MNLQAPDFSQSGYTEITPLPPQQPPVAPLVSPEQAMRAQEVDQTLTPEAPLLPVMVQTGEPLPPPIAAATANAMMPWLLAGGIAIAVTLIATIAFRTWLAPTRQLLILQTIAHRITGKKRRVLDTLAKSSGIHQAILLSTPGAMKHAITTAGPLLDQQTTAQLTQQVFGTSLIEIKPIDAQAPVKSSAKPQAKQAPGMMIRKPMTPRKLGIAGGVAAANSQAASATSRPSPAPQAQSRGGVDGRASGSSPRK
jgi:hypothetical protein